MNKKGVSSVIATILLIALVVVLATIVFLWARGFIKEQIEKFGTPIENQCENIDWEVRKVASSGDITSLSISNNGNIPIYDVSIGLSDGLRKEIKTYDPPLKINPGKSLIKDFNITSNKGLSVKKITVYPILLGSVVGKQENKMKTCLENGIDIDI